MRRNWLPTIGLLILCGAVATWWLTRPSEEKRIRKQFTRLAERFSKNEAETTTSMALKLNGLGSLFDTNVAIHLREQDADGTYSSSEISSHAARVRAMFTAIRLSFHDLKVTFRSDKEAEAVVTARLMLHPRDGEASTDTREITAVLVRSEDKSWRFRSFTENDVMTR